MKDYDERSPKSIEAYAKKLIGLTFQDVLDRDNAKDIENKKNRGDLGQLIERHHFHYECNSDSNPDFSEAGVELKVTPYKINQNKSISAKERLVLTKINYYEIVREEGFEKSHLWNKSRLILLIYYLYLKEVEKRFGYEIKYCKLYTPPEEDKIIIQQDYNYIVNKIKAGKAHELSEGDTMYLGACTKGVKATDRVKQPYSTELAKPRAFSFKQSYMTYVLNHYVVADKDTYEAIANTEELIEKSFEEIVKEKLEKYEGMYESEIEKELGIEINRANKGYEGTLVCKMLGVKNNRVEEFEKAGILVKVLKYRQKKSLNQQFRLDDIVFKELDKEKFDEEIRDEETNEAIGWEFSKVYDMLHNRKYLFVVFWEDEKGSKYKGCQIWGMPDKDIEKVREVWKRIKNIVRNGIEMWVDERGRVCNNLPGISDNGIFHIRPHASKTYYLFKDGTIHGNGKISDSDIIGLGREERIARQAYWLNRSYIDQQINKNLRRV